MAVLPSMGFDATSRNSKPPIKDAYGIRALNPGLDSEASRTWVREQEYASKKAELLSRL